MKNFSTVATRAAAVVLVAVSVLGNETMAVPGAIYGVLMFFPAALAAYLFSRTSARVEVS